ncbi:C40 family peptidase [bacterium]|nr:C40 family peptidase [bacterium]
MTASQSIPSWAEHYVGLPWLAGGRDRSGVDCWGLVRMVLDEQFHVELPLWNECSDPEQSDCAGKAIASHRDGMWREIVAGEEQLGDIVLMQVAGDVSHVGLVLGGGMMLHAHRAAGSVVESYIGPRWSRRVRAFVRNERMVTK